MNDSQTFKKLLNILFGWLTTIFGIKISSSVRLWMFWGTMGGVAVVCYGLVFNVGNPTPKMALNAPTYEISRNGESSIPKAEAKKPKLPKYSTKYEFTAIDRYHKTDIEAICLKHMGSRAYIETTWGGYKKSHILDCKMGEIYFTKYDDEQYTSTRYDKLKKLYIYTKQD